MRDMHTLGRTLFAAAVLATGGCAQGPQGAPDAAAPGPTTAAARSSAAVGATDAVLVPPQPATPATTEPTPRTPSASAGPASTPPPDASLPEPATPPGDAAPQAAATVTETYFALLQAGKEPDADALWRDRAQAAAFRAQYASLGRPQVEVDAPEGMEGAAGSSYVTVPVRFIPAAGAPNPRPRHGEVVLRRVNDVPGSTTDQRRWHIDRIDVAMTPR